MFLPHGFPLTTCFDFSTFLSMDFHDAGYDMSEVTQNVTEYIVDVVFVCVYFKENLGLVKTQLMSQLNQLQAFRGF